MPSSLRLLLVTVLIGRALGSRISFFSDGECGNFKSDIPGPNGYPDGECSLLAAKGNFSSFKVVRVDRGCDVTIYGPNTAQGICSPDGAIVADLGTCYNDSSWTYYSIDTCARRGHDESSSSASPSTLKSISSTTASSQPTSPSDTASAATSSDTNTGAIAGGVVGGVAGLALIAGGLWLFLRRRRRGGQIDQNAEDTAGPSEVSGAPVVEMSGKEVPKPSELPEARAEAYSEPPPQELSAEGEGGGGVARGEKPPL